MKLLICIDDTDNIESKGTGTIADEIRNIIKEKGFGVCGVVTRHQLLIHKDIPYTSHNSSMCFECEIEDVHYNELEKLAVEHLRTESAEGSDPGICIAKITDHLDEASLIDFGLSAKRTILNKQTAYDLAQEAGVFLKEEGGTGQGIIGALAGVGLRLSGNDGEVKGEIKQFKKGEIYTAEQLKSDSIIQHVTDADLTPVNNNERVFVEWKAKPVIANGTITLIVSWIEDKQIWTTMNKKQLREFGDNRIYEKGCKDFVPDVIEEQIIDSRNSCLNCRYRKWTDESFLCTYPRVKKT
jgi:hypothetical protein